MSKRKQLSWKSSLGKPEGERICSYLDNVRIALTPPPLCPVFLDTYKELFLCGKKCRAKMFILTKVKQKDASNVFGLRSTPSPPLWECPNPRREKSASIWIKVSPPTPHHHFEQCPTMSRFFLCLASLSQGS